MSKNKLAPILFVPDLHAPYHDKRALSLVLDVAKDLKPEILVVMGDLADFFSVSSYSKDPSRAGKLEDEMRAVNSILDALDALGAGRKIYLAGNHEDRLRRYLEDKAPELFHLIDVPKILRLEERGWRFVPYKSSTKIGKLHLTHDVGSAGRYNVFRTLDAFQHPVMTAHTHRFAYIVEGNATGEAMLSAQLGWLGDVSKIDYMHQIKAKRDWALGFGIGYLNRSSGHVHVTPIPIVRHQAVVNGKLYETPKAVR